MEKNLNLYKVRSPSFGVTINPQNVSKMSNNFHLECRSKRPSGTSMITSCMFNPSSPVLRPKSNIIICQRIINYIVTGVYLLPEEYFVDEGGFISRLIFVGPRKPIAMDVIKSQQLERGTYRIVFQISCTILEHLWNHGANELVTHFFPSAICSLTTINSNFDEHSVEPACQRQRSTTSSHSTLLTKLPSSQLSDDSNTLHHRTSIASKNTPNSLQSQHSFFPLLTTPPTCLNSTSSTVTPSPSSQTLSNTFYFSSSHKKVLTIIIDITDIMGNYSSAEDLGQRIGYVRFFLVSGPLFKNLRRAYYGVLKSDAEIRLRQDEVVWLSRKCDEFSLVLWDNRALLRADFVEFVKYFAHALQQNFTIFANGNQIPTTSKLRKLTNVGRRLGSKLKFCMYLDAPFEVKRYCEKRNVKTPTGGIFYAFNFLKCAHTSEVELLSMAKTIVGLRPFLDLSYSLSKQKIRKDVCQSAKELAKLSFLEENSSKINFVSMNSETYF